LTSLTEQQCTDAKLTATMYSFLNRDINPCYSWQENQSITYAHSCLWFIILIKMTTNNSSWKSVVLWIFCQTKPGCYWLGFQDNQFIRYVHSCLNP